MKPTKENIRSWIAMGGSKCWFTFKQNKRKRMPERTVEIVFNSPNNYTARGIINDKEMFCETGITLSSAVAIVWAAACGD